MNIGFLITARMKSTRLPQKLTLTVENREFIRWMIDRVKLSKKISKIILCTSVNLQDDVLEEIATEENVLAFRGHEDDVLQRLFEASKKYNLDYALNITADCPLVSYEYIDKIVEKYEETGADFIRSLDLPHGFFSYGLKIEALKKACEIKKGTNTEVWGRYFTDTGMFHVVDLKIPDTLQRPNYRLTLDYPEDYEFFKHVYNHFGTDTCKKPTKDIIDFLDQNPQVVEINKDMKFKYQKNWNKQNQIKI